MSTKRLSEKITDAFEDDPKTLRDLGIKVRKSKNDKQRDRINSMHKKYKGEQDVKRLMQDRLGTMLLLSHWVSMGE